MAICHSGVLTAWLQQDNDLLVDGVVVKPAYRSTPVEAEKLEQLSQRTKVLTLRAAGKHVFAKGTGLHP
jgi:hypothetical protein